MNANELRLDDLVIFILHDVYVANKKAFQREARKRSLTLEQLAAAAITQALWERRESGSCGVN